MTSYTPDELRTILGSGLLSFPVTHARADLSLDEDGYREHVAWQAGFGPAGLFAAGGTGEIFALTPAEVPRVVRAAVAEAPDGLPILGPAAYGTAQAVQMAREAEQAGAHGILLFPPYLTEVSQDGLVAHVRAVCAATSLGVIVYHRANARFTAESIARLTETCPNLIGFKDGVGDVELMTRLYAGLDGRLLFIGGLPTAEVYALPYLEMGLTTYSSAIFNFVPRFALDFHRSVLARDREDVYLRLRSFVLPYLEIRDRSAGYPVSIVKAGLTAIGRPAGPVRPPLTDLTGAEQQALTTLIEGIAQVEHADRDLVGS
ncbi:5-dehydro-4-deoxyglucarate dehydratase [Occultella glacieicola]|uniref:Probable 5-dehydro-4-deoxyglucarate dehydratase n=1 Tax=Occultella glacieicola TaxID=2518684 RepID=A0ABY2E474_9MICO|nr:5-dehydro-4-deoxyglucarate dehydratase [Occultella glacieicola]TDE91563.1 5-dehydro-4-deoxyglucarate dehydratase [Occultella glacieicola]